MAQRTNNGARSKRGLASADAETRRRVAQKGGEASAKARSEAAKSGGR